MLVCPPELRLEFANGTGFFSDLRPKNVDNRLSLPAREFKLNKGRTIKVGANPQLEMRGDEKHVGLVLRIMPYHEKSDEMTFNGTWTYQANLDLTAAKKRWAWSWDYTGTATDKEGKLMRLLLKVDGNGKESKKVGEVLR